MPFRFFAAALLAALPLWTPVNAQGNRDFVQVPATGPLAKDKLYGRSFALLVGVNRYANAPANNLRYAVNDVKALRDVLIRSYGFPAENVFVLTDEQATREKIREALNDLTDSKRVGKDDRILIYFSGHGQTVTLSSGGETGFLIPNDAQIDLSDSGNIAPYRRSCLSLGEIWETLDGCPARHVLLLADCCFSGLLAQSKAYAKPSRETLAALAHKRTRQIMTAGGAGEESQEDSRWGHGAFTYELLEELSAHAALEETVFTARELHASLQFDVANLTKAKQNPLFRDKDTEGEFLFFTTPPRPVPPLVIASNSVNPVRHEPKQPKGFRFNVASPVRAEQQYREALAKSPQDFGLTMEAAKFMMMIGKDNAEAMRLYHVAAALRPDSPEPYNWLGYMQLYCIKPLDVNEAEKLFRKALEIDPKCVFAWHEIADVNGYFTKRDWAEAERIELKVIALDPKFSEAYESLGWACKRRNDLAQAEIYFRKGWEAKRGNFYNALGLAEIWRQQGKISEAEEILRAALEVEPDNVNPDWNERSLNETYTALGRLYLNQKKDYKAAERFLGRALERNPYDASLKADLKRAIAAQKN